MAFKIPSHFSLRDAQTLATTVGAVHQMLTSEVTEQFKAPYRHTGRWLGEFAIPNFQRPLKWDEARQVKFVESAWLGVSLGNYVVNDLGRYTEKGIHHPLHDTLIDGQQRIEAFRAYFNDEIEVFGSKWSEVPQKDKRHLLMLTHFTRIVICIPDEDKLREVYNRLCFGGVAHEESERA